MEVLRIIKNISLPLLAGILTITLLAFLLPGLLFIPSLLTQAWAFNRIYYDGGKDFLSLDLSLLASVLIIGGLPSLLKVGGCLFLPGMNTCSSNQLRATVFMVVSFPILCGLVLWLVLRLPMVIKSLFRK
jgi:hypothetical protein